MKSKFITWSNKSWITYCSIFLCSKDPYEAKYQFLINKRESTGLKYLNDLKAFIEYSNDTDDIYRNI